MSAKFTPWILNIVERSGYFNGAITYMVLLLLDEISSCSQPSWEERFARCSMFQRQVYWMPWIVPWLQLGSKFVLNEWIENTCHALLYLAFKAASQNYDLIVCCNAILLFQVFAKKYFPKFIRKKLQKHYEKESAD